MAKFNFGQTAKDHEKEAGGGNIFKFKEGANPMRIVSASEPYHSNYQGKLTLRFLTYILDRSDHTLKLAFLPYKIVKMLGDLQSNPEYAFDEVPMPYDITINATNAGQMNVQYTIMPARNNTPLGPDELRVISEAKPLKEVKDYLKKKQAQQTTLNNPVQGAPVPPEDNFADHEYPEDTINVDDVNF